MLWLPAPAPIGRSSIQSLTVSRHFRKCGVFVWAWNAAASTYTSYSQIRFGSAPSWITSNRRQPGSSFTEPRASPSIASMNSSLCPSLI